MTLGQIIGGYKQIYKLPDFMTTRGRFHEIEQVCSDHGDSGAYQVLLWYEKVLDHYTRPVDFVRT